MPLMGNISFIQYAIIAMMGAARVITGAMTLGNITPSCNTLEQFPDRLPWCLIK